MKKYTLASPEARKNVDLRNHSDIIIKAVHDVVPVVLCCHNRILQ